ncbi:AtzE family amidohydrolase, partial [Klebsiella pneumoniae]
MTELTDLGIAGLRDGVARGDFTATEVATAFNAAVAQANPALNAFIVTTPDHALAAAARVDAARAAWQPLGKLAGVP